METIGDKIKALRKSKNISQEDLAFEIDVSRQTIHKWERGAVQPNTDNLKALCDYFEVSSNYFIMDNGCSVENETAITAISPKSKKYLIICSIITAIVFLAFITSVVCTIVFGFIVFSKSSGHIIVSMFEIDSYVFYLFLSLSLILLAINVVMIFLMKKK